jgi:carboxyl-terminal processing protease
MSLRFFGKYLRGAASSGVLLALCLGPNSGRTADANDGLTRLNITNEPVAFHPLTPGPLDGQIAYVTASMLQKYQYLRQPFDDTVSSKFLDRYLETLDPQHLHFLQSDIADFEIYRTNLNKLTLPDGVGAPSARPATVIFNRFVQRLEQRVAYADELLKNEKFTFDADERISVIRKDAPYPKDLVEAKKLWRDRLRYEYLQEKLGKDETKKKAAARAAARPEGTSPASSSQDTQEQEANVAVEDSKPKKTDAEDIVETLSHRYHRQLHTFVNWDSDDVLQFYLTALTRVYDPHSDYFGHSALDSFSITMNLSLFGIGAELMSEDGYCTINRLLPGGPAIKSKQIHEKDKIIAVGQSNQPPVDVVDMSLNKAVQLIRGPKGTEVRLTVVPAGKDNAAKKIVTLVRDEIKLEDQEAKAKIIDMPNGQGGNTRLGVIDLPSFYTSFDPTSSRSRTQQKSTTEDVSRLLKKLKAENVNGVILDLRRNGGGSLEEAIRLTGLFIKEGPVVQVKDYDGHVDVDRDDDPSVLYDGPLIVLTSRFSASASEILAGALQDYGRALIVGDSSTHGKGTVQQVLPLGQAMLRLMARHSENLSSAASMLMTNDPGAVKLTIKKFYRASGHSTQLKGVVPDVVLPSVFSVAKEIGEAALENPMPWDTISPAKYDKLNLVAPYLPELRRLSAQRIASDKEFSYIREDIDIYKKKSAEKTVSLNEAQRLKEREADEARLKARDKERLARKEPAETIYEISLKQAVQPGLPSPVQKTNSVAKLDGPGTAGATTNGAIAAAPGPRRIQDGEDDLDEDKAAAVDAPLIEAEHILLDYLGMLPKGSLVTAGH